MKTKFNHWMLLTLMIGAALFTSCSEEGISGLSGDTHSWLNGSTWMISGKNHQNQEMTLTLGFNGGQVTYQEYNASEGTSYSVYGPFKHSGNKLKFKFVKEYQNKIQDLSIFPTTAVLHVDDNNMYNSYILYNDNKFMFQQDW